MMDESCHICDRADCPTITIGASPSPDEMQEANADCWAHKVDWRDRALTTKTICMQLHRELAGRDSTISYYRGVLGSPATLRALLDLSVAAAGCAPHVQSAEQSQPKRKS